MASTIKMRTVADKILKTHKPSGLAAWHLLVLRRLPHDWVRRWPPQLISGVLLVLIALVIWRGVRDWQPARVPGNTSVPMTIARLSQPSAAVSVAALVKAHLFGISVPTAQVAAAPPSDWQVVGLVAGPAAGNAIADLSINGEEHLWHVGERLPDGSTLTAISSQGVTIARGGQELLLPFTLRPAASDAKFTTLTVQAASAAPVVRPESSATPARVQMRRPVTQQLSALRHTALRIWAARARRSPP